MSPMVKVGIDRITAPEWRKHFENQQIGLVTNASGISAAHGYLGTVEVMHAHFTVASLFAPEHGVRGVLAPGEKVAGGIDELSGLPVHSLFEDFVFTPKTQEAQARSAYAPTSAMMDGLDLMVFDMQDVGSRYFTYASTLFYTMRSCASVGLPLWVLDRPNPLGGEAVEGCRQDEDCTSFIGLTSVPIRHGLTMGELALYYNHAYGLGCDLHILPMEGWRRDMTYADTGLPFVRPSPNLPTLDAVTVYNGTCMLAGTNASEGRGTTTPFTTVGAPYVHPVKLAEAMNDLHLPGLTFSPTHFLPQFSKYRGEVCRGVDIHVTQPRAVRAVSLGLHLVHTLRTLFPDDFAFLRPPEGARWHIDLSTGNRDLREGRLTPEEIIEKWQVDGERFKEEAKQYHLY